MPSASILCPSAKRAAALSGMPGQPGLLDRLSRSITAALVLLVLFATVLGFQWAAGAFTAEFSGYPDEAAHYMSGLLVRDYAAAGFPAHPVDFGQKFYLRFPYLAIGHWPPFFYALESAWMLGFSTSRISVMLLMALITALLAQATFVALRNEFGRGAAFMGALLVVCIPVVQQYASLVMMDTLLALLSFWAVLYLGRYCEMGRWRDSLMFGTLTCLAILTKGNGFDLAFVPPFAVILSRRFYLLKRLSFWLPAVMVLLVSVPWHFLTMHLMLPTFVYTFGGAFTLQAMRFYAGLLLRSLGPVVLALAVIGFFTQVIRPAKNGVDTKWAAVAALLLGIIVFYCVVPAGIETRYFIAAMPPLVMFFVAGAEVIAGSIKVRSWKPRRLASFLIVMALLAFAIPCFKVTRKKSYGFREAARSLAARPEWKDSVTLVSSGINFGEGLLISEVAMVERQNGQTILRASKVLADEDWNGTKSQPRYANAENLMKCLDTSAVRFLVLDRRSRGRMAEHHRQLWEIVNTWPDRWKVAGSFSGEDGDAVYVYASTRMQGSATDRGAKPLVMTNMSGAVSNWPIVISLPCGADASDLPHTQPGNERFLVHDVLFIPEPIRKQVAAW